MMPRSVMPVCVCVVCGGGGSHGCKSMPDTVNVSEIQPSMERHTSVRHVKALAAIKEHVHGVFFIPSLLYMSF